MRPRSVACLGVVGADIARSSTLLTEPVNHFGPIGAGNHFRGRWMLASLASQTVMTTLPRA